MPLSEEDYNKLSGTMRATADLDKEMGIDPAQTPQIQGALQGKEVLPAFPSSLPPPSADIPAPSAAPMEPQVTPLNPQVPPQQPESEHERYRKAIQKYSGYDIGEEQVTPPSPENYEAYRNAIKRYTGHDIGERSGNAKVAVKGFARGSVESWAEDPAKGAASTYSFIKHADAINTTNQASKTLQAFDEIDHGAQPLPTDDIPLPFDASNAIHYYHQIATSPSLSDDEKKAQKQALRDQWQARIESKMSEKMSIGPELEDNPLMKAGNNIAKWKDEAIPATPEEQNRLSYQIGSGVASVMPLIGTGGTGALIKGGAEGLGRKALGEVVEKSAYPYGMAMQGGAGYEDAKQAGATPEQQVEAGAANTVLGLSEYAPVERGLAAGAGTLRGFFRTAKETGIPLAEAVTIATRRYGPAIAHTATEEAAQEYGQQLGQNYIASDLAGYDPNRPITQDAASSALVGGIVGGGTGAVTNFIGRRAAQAQQKLQEQQLAAGNYSPARETPIVSEDQLRAEGLITPGMPEVELPGAPTTSQGGKSGTENTPNSVTSPEGGILNQSNSTPLNNEVPTPEEEAALSQKMDAMGNAPAPAAEPTKITINNPDAKIRPTLSQNDADQIIASMAGEEELPTLDKPTELPSMDSEGNQTGLMFYDPATGHMEPITPDRSFDDILKDRTHIKAATDEDTQLAGVRAATSPLNDTPAPTEAQKKAGNYRMGKVNIQGLDISIENPRGSTRSGTNAQGEQWSNEMPHDYGYIKGTEGADGDHIDTFIGPNPQSETVFVIDTKNPETGKFDEHKSFVGFDSMDEAKNAFSKAYPGVAVSHYMGSKEMTMPEFKVWVKSPKSKKPVSRQPARQAPSTPPITPVPVANTPVVNTPETAQSPISQPIPELATTPFAAARKRKSGQPMDLLEFIAHRGGIKEDSNELSTIGLKKNIPFLPKLIHEGGMHLDYAREAAKEAGYGDFNTIREFLDALRNSAHGQKIYTLSDQSRIFDKQQAKKDKEQGTDVDAGYKAIAQDLGINTDNRSLEDIMVDIHERESIQSEGAVSDEIADIQENDLDSAFEENLPPLFEEVNNSGLTTQNEVLSPHEVDTRTETGTQQEAVGDNQQIRQRQEELAGGQGKGEEVRASTTSSSEVESKGPETRKIPTERTALGEQSVIPGAEKISEKEQAQRGAGKPLAAKVAQKSMQGETNLFDQSENQQDELFGATKKKAKEEPPLFQRAGKIESPKFKKWFGDSKVVDENGNPLVVYHGTGADVNIFNRSKSRSKANNGFYFTNDPQNAATYASPTWDDKLYKYDEEVGGNILPVYLSIQNPLIIDAHGSHHRSLGTKGLKGYKSKDGIIQAVYHPRLPENLTLTPSSERTEAWVDMVNKEHLYWVIKTPYNDVKEFADKKEPSPTAIEKQKELISLAEKDGKEIVRTSFHKEIFGTGKNRYYYEEPIVFIRAETEHDDSIWKIAEDAENKGYDGVIIKNVEDSGHLRSGPPTTTYITFKPEQIKSVHNSGEFDSKNPNILFQRPADAPPGISDDGKWLEVNGSALKIKPVAYMDEKREALVKELNARAKAIGGDRVTLVLGEHLAEKESGDNVSGYFLKQQAIEGGPLSYFIFASLASPNVMGTVNHELVHYLRQSGLINDPTWDHLVKMADSEWIDKYQIVARYDDLVEGRSDKVKNTLFREEAIAEAYGDWAQGKLSPPRQSVGIFQKIKKLFQSFHNYLTGEGINNWQDVFQIVERGELATNTYQGFNPEQVEQIRKSDKENTHLFQRPPGVPSAENAYNANWNFPDEKLGDIIFDRNKTIFDRDNFKAGYKASSSNQIRLWQDRMQGFKDIENIIEKATGEKLTEAERVYRAEELYSGRVGGQLDKINRLYREPIVKLLAKIQAGLPAGETAVDQVEAYLYANHADERNKVIGKINPQFATDGGSGITHAEAMEILRNVESSKFASEIKEASGLIREMLDKSLKMRLDNGLISTKEYDDLSKYKDYVPLRGFKEIIEDDGETGIKRGKGYDVRGEEYRKAFGRKTRAANLLANSFAVAEESVVRSEKNRVAISLYNLVKANPNSELWGIDEVKHVPFINSDTGFVEHRAVTVQDARQNNDTIVVAKLKGKTARVRLQDQRLARPMRNLDMDNASALIQGLSKVNRFLSHVNTGFNPSFIVSNAIRDAMAGAINLQQYDIKDLTKNAKKYYVKAMGGVYGSLRGKEETEWHKWYQEFQEAGGKVSFNQMDTIKSRADQLLKDVALLQQGHWNTAKRGTLALKKWIEDANGAVENALRLSTYVSARQAGVSKSDAASMAKNITVNFNRRGELGHHMNAYYLFYNAGVQGTAVIFNAMKSKRVRQIVAAITVFGFALDMLNAAWSDDDDDGKLKYDKIAEWEKDSNIVISLPKGPVAEFAKQYLKVNNYKGMEYVKLPSAHGYRSFFGMGRNISAVMRGAKQPSTAAVDIFSSILSSFNPLGGSGNLLQMLSPTALDPAVDLYLNKDWKGDKIVPTRMARTPVPESQLSQGNTSWFAKQVAEKLNMISGGDKVVPGAIDVSPNVLDYLWNFSTGGAGRFVKETIQTTATMAQRAAGQSIPEEDKINIKDIPVLQKIVGATSSYQDKEEAHTRIKEIYAVKDRLKRYIDQNEVPAAKKYLAENKKLLLVQTSDGQTINMYDYAKNLEKQLKTLGEAKGVVKNSKLSDEQKTAKLNGLFAIEKKAVDTFNLYYNQAHKLTKETTRPID